MNDELIHRLDEAWHMLSVAADALEHSYEEALKMDDGELTAGQIKTEYWNVNSAQKRVAQMMERLNG